MLFQGPEHEDVDLMSCAGKDCNLPLTIFATMVPFAATQSILVRHAPHAAFDHLYFFISSLPAEVNMYNITNRAPKGQVEAP